MPNPPIILSLTVGGETCRGLAEVLHRRPPGTAVVVSIGAVDAATISALVEASHDSLTASVSPLTIRGVLDTKLIVAADQPPPTVARPSPNLVLLLPAPLELFSRIFEANEGWEEALRAWSDVTRHHGWRHIAAPRVVGAPPKFHDPLAAELEGPANELLSTHRLWATTQLRPPRIAVDGACFLPGAEATGTYQLVLELVRSLALVRPDSALSVAVPQRSIPSVSPRFADLPNVRIVSRKRSDPYDIVYRPYQFIRHEEVDWTFGNGARTVLGQLDMIGFSNDSYHPQPSMFFGVRNLQRATLRRADLVVTISNFAAKIIRSECPDLEVDRLAVVPCGTDHQSPTEFSRPNTLGIDVVDFIACLSATFWHKNRMHAIRTFAELRSRGYRGYMVIAGPEPYFGRSTDEETSLIASLPKLDRQAIVRLGSVSEGEKWWLLSRARVVLYPSINEGFGLVPFEAASVGTPTLTGRTASLPEVLGDQVTFGEHWNPMIWADIVAEWLRDPLKALAQVTEISRRGAELSWMQAAERTWSEFDRTLSRPRRVPLAHEGDRWSAVERHHLGLTHVSQIVRQRNRVRARIRRIMAKSR